MFERHTDLSRCNKCGLPVGPTNDVVWLDYIMTGNPLLLFAQSRHLFPVVVWGVRVCEGSPSRAQYLEGQPRDSRPEYSYAPDQEAAFRAAYVALVKGYVATLMEKGLQDSKI